MKPFQFAAVLLSFAAVCPAADSLLTYSQTLPVLQSALASGVITASAMDQRGNTYFAGSTQNPSFPTTAGVVQPSFGGGEDAFVVKISPKGVILFATYLGGSGFDRATSVAVDSEGGLYVGGITMPGTGKPFPATSPSPFPSNAPGTSFIAKMDLSGSRLIYSFIIPGANGKVALMPEPEGNLHFVGTGGAQFPVTSGSVQGSGSIVTGELDAQGKTYIFGARFGGSSPNETAADLVIDGNLDMYITGTTSSADFPVTPGAFQTSLRGPATSSAFAVKMKGNGTALLYATYLGGSRAESASQIRVDAYGDAFVLGKSQSSDFPVTSGAYQPTNPNISSSAFLAKLNPGGTGLIYATYVPGIVGLTNTGDPVSSVGAFDIDGQGDAFLVSQVNGGLKTTTSAYQPNPAGGFDCGLIMLDRQGQLVAASYFGGSGDETPTAVAVTPDGLVAFAGTTTSTDLPITAGNPPSGLTSFVAQVRISSAIPSPPPTYFQMGDGVGETIVVRFTKPEAVRGAWEMMRGRKRGSMRAKIVRSAAFYNPQWKFHVDTTSVIIDQTAIEACDADLSFMAEQGDNMGGAFLPGLVWCPWTQVLPVELPNPSGEEDHIRHGSAADFTEVALAPGALAAGFGTNIAQAPLSPPPGETPATLGGVSVSIKDSAGAQWAVPILYVSPSQVNYLMPPGIAVGRAIATVTTWQNRAISEEIYIQPLSPSMFTVGSSGFANGYLARFKADGTMSAEPLVTVDPSTGKVTAVPIDLGPETDQVYLIVYGTGIRNLIPPDWLIGGFAREYGMGSTELYPVYAGPQTQYPGLDQIVALLPHGLAGAGTGSLKFTSTWFSTSGSEIIDHHQYTEPILMIFK